MEKAYKFRIYPNEKQEQLMQRIFGCCRFVYNYYLALRTEKYEKEGVTFNYNACSADLTALKKELSWLCETDSTALQSSLKDLEAAYRNFFRGRKTGEDIGFPNFKSKRTARKSYISKAKIVVLDGCVKLPKLGKVKCRVSRPVEGRILNATVSQEPSGKYFVSLCCTDVEVPQYESTGKAVGIDLGLKELAITSDGETFENPKPLRKAEKKLARLQRQLSRKSKGSANRRKARIKVARFHEKVANQRRDALHKLTTKLVEKYDLIAIETLRPANMVKNRRLAKSISDASWGELVRQLEYKMAWQHKVLVKVDPFFASSQTCHVCGEKNPATKNLAVRSWLCEGCGATHDRDHNAAINILQEGLRLVS